jgi:hypothetical protein
MVVTIGQLLLHARMRCRFGVPAYCAWVQPRPSWFGQRRLALPRDCRELRDRCCVSFVSVVVLGNIDEPAAAGGDERVEHVDQNALTDTAHGRS